MNARDLLHELHASLSERYQGDCTDYATRLAEMLLAEGRAPWIGRVRHEENGMRMPLIPSRYLGHGAIAWTTHYVACADGEAWEPILGEPVAIDSYTTTLFGEPYALAMCVDEHETARLVASGSLRSRLL
ncbi:MAG TPA: hypothetical protein VFN10_12745 [Thermoanaerobaculia bacterium]|nr:hypothetical protein [Thermoanaerobaculia bacterium]